MGNFDDHGSDVVGPARVVSRGDQGGARIAGIALRTKDLYQGFLADHAVQPVAAQQDPITRPQTYRGGVGQRRRVHRHMPGNHAAGRVLGGISGGNFSSARRTSTRSARLADFARKSTLDVKSQDR